MVRAILDNPVVTKEFRSRMRGSRAYWLLFGYLLTLSLVLFFSYMTWWNSHSESMEYGGATASFTVGREFFLYLFYAQAILVTLITPALTAGAFSIEREQRTFELLRSTTLTPPAIVLGKLMSSVSFIVLLLTTSLPLISLCFLLGGVSPGEVFFAYLLLVCDAFLFGAMGLVWSIFGANTATATALAYGTVFAFFAATFPLATPLLNSFGDSIGLCAMNPVGAVTGAVVAEPYFRWIWPAWVPALILNGTLGILLSVICINRLEDYPAHRARPVRLLSLLFCAEALFFGDGMIIGQGAKDTSIGGQFVLITVVAMGMLLLVTPIFVTGDGGEEEALPGAWRLRQFLSYAALPSGFPFALLLTVMASALCWAAMQNPDFAPTVQITPAFLGGACVLLASVVLGLTGLGFGLSTALGNRWASLTMLYLILLLAMALPCFSFLNGSNEDGVAAMAGNPAINSLYLCPLMALIQIGSFTDPQFHFETDKPIVTHLIGYDMLPMWMTTSALYLVIGAISCALAFVMRRRRQASMERATRRVAPTPFVKTV